MKIWDAEGYDRHARFVSDLGAPLIDLLAPAHGERILDLGCGDGALTVRIAGSGARVVGVDTSEAFVAAARARGVDARAIDAERLPFEGEFDAVFSNAALHWMLDARAVATGVRRALRPGGRFVGEFGAHGNVASIATATIAALDACGFESPTFPWYFPTPDAYRALLEVSGFVVERIAAFARPTPLPTGLRPWLETFADPFLAAVPPARREAVFDRAERYLAPSLRAPDGRWIADYVRLRFVAHATTAS